MAKKDLFDVQPDSSVRSPVLFRTRFMAPFSSVDPGVGFPGDDAHPDVLKRERRTKQEFKQDCDVNLIMAKYRKTGILPESAKAAAARYGDFSQIPDFMQMQEKIIAANELFASLPAAVRKQFDNDPGQFIAASETKEGVELMQKLGLGKEADPKAPAPSPASPAVRAGQAQGGGTVPPPAGAKPALEPNKEGTDSGRKGSDK